MGVVLEIRIVGGSLGEDGWAFFPRKASVEYAVVPRSEFVLVDVLTLGRQSCDDKQI